MKNKPLPSSMQDIEAGLIDGSIVEIGLGNYEWAEVCKCGKPAEEPSPCPFDLDINDYTRLCTCCSDCKYACLMDI